MLTYAYEEGILNTLPLKPKIQRRDNPRIAFKESEYKQLLKVTRQLADTGIKVRGVPLTLELYYFITLVIHTFMRPTEGEIFNIRHKDITQVEDPKSLQILFLDGKTGTRTLNTTTDAVDMYKNLKKNSAPIIPKTILYFIHNTKIEARLYEMLIACLTIFCGRRL